MGGVVPVSSLAYDTDMSAIEFETELSGQPILSIPPEVVAQLPKSGRAKVVLLVRPDVEDEEWLKWSYEQFMKDDSPDDAVYDNYQ